MLTLVPRPSAVAGNQSSVNGTMMPFNFRHPYNHVTYPYIDINILQDFCDRELLKNELPFLLKLISAKKRHGTLFNVQKG